MLPGEREVGGLRCGEALALLSEWVDGEIGEGQLARLRAHVGGCEVCASFGAQFSAAVASLRARHAIGPPADVSDRLRARLATESG
jgi:anti-sigma factor RsiW